MGGSAEVCLQWNNFRNNVNTVSGTFRGNANLADVTLVCEDGEKVEAHEIALTASSALPFQLRPGQFSVLWVGTELLRHLYRLSTKYNIGLRQYSRELLQY